MKEFDLKVSEIRKANKLLNGSHQVEGNGDLYKEGPEDR
jgi:hypothetical protein